jgi:hypothetical protein
MGFIDFFARLFADADAKAAEAKRKQALEEARSEGVLGPTAGTDIPSTPIEREAPTPDNQQGIGQDDPPVGSSRRGSSPSP